MTQTGPWTPLRGQRPRRTYDLVAANSGLGPDGAVFSRIIEAVRDSRAESARETSLLEAQSVQGPRRWYGYFISGRSIEGRRGRENKGVRLHHRSRREDDGGIGGWPAKESRQDGPQQTALSAVL